MIVHPPSGRTYESCDTCKHWDHDPRVEDPDVSYGWCDAEHPVSNMTEGGMWCTAWRGMVESSVTRPTREELEARGRTVPPKEMTAEQIARLDELTAVADARRALAEVRARCTLEDPDEPPPRMWTCPARLDASGRHVVCDYPGVSGACAAKHHEDELAERGLL